MSGFADGARERWVFGYGSLMWRPGFPYVEKQRAVLHGRRRAFCIYSVHHRGVPEAPGLVLGLAPGGSVRGIAFRVAPEDWPGVQSYLLEREQPTQHLGLARGPEAERLGPGGLRDLGRHHRRGQLGPFVHQGEQLRIDLVDARAHGG